MTMIINMITLYMIICSCETLTMPPATDHKNIIGSIVKVESTSTILMMMVIMSQKLGSKGLIISGSQNFGLLTECYNSDNICQTNKCRLSHGKDSPCQFRCNIKKFTSTDCCVRVSLILEGQWGPAHPSKSNFEQLNFVDALASLDFKLSVTE